MDRGSHGTSDLNYIDFDVEVAQGSGRKYPVTVRSPASGEAHAEMRFPYVKGVLDSKLKDLELALYTSGGTHRRINAPAEQTVQDFGRSLFDALLPGEVRSCYEVALREAERQGKGLRLRLHIRPPHLAVLPWEFLYDARQGEYVCLSTHTPIVRYPDLPQPVERLPVTPPLHILGMVVTTRDLDPLDVDYEKQRVEEALKDLRARGLVELTWLEGQTWRDLQKAMRRGPWHVFHFIGHGGYDPNREEGLIAFANDAGYTHRLYATELARLLDDHRPLRLVLLNSCEGARGSESDALSGTAITLVRRGIPAVLAMQYEISDEAAIEFSRAFYEAAADGLPVDAAVAEARTAISIAIGDTLEWGTPVLYMRSPDGRIFDILAAPQPAASVQENKTTGSQGSEQASEKLTETQATDAHKAKPDQGQPSLGQLYTAAMGAYGAQRWEEAIGYFEDIQKLDPDYADVPHKLDEARRQQRLSELYTKAEQLHKQRDWHGVIGIFERIHELDTGYADPAQLLASARKALRVVGWWRRRRNLVISGIGSVVSLLGAVSGLTLCNPGVVPPIDVVATPTATVGVVGQAATATVHAPSATAAPTAVRLPSSDGAMAGADLRHTGVYETSGEVPTGTLEWQLDLGVAITRPPTFFDGVIYVGGGDGDLRAIDAETSEVIWTYSASEHGINNTPAVAAGVIYFGGVDGNLYALDASTQEETWIYSAGSRISYSSPAVSEGVVYVGSADGKLHAVDVESGKDRWPAYNARAPIHTSPAVAEGGVYFGTADGRLHAVDARTGRRKWPSYSTESVVHTLPAVVDGVVYFGSQDGRLHALDAHTGEPEWEPVQTGGHVTTAAVSEGIVYFGSADGKLYAVDGKTGQEVWTQQVGGAIEGNPPAIASDVIYFCSTDLKLYAVDLRAERILWTYPTGETLCSGAVIADGVVYFATGDGHVYALR